MGAIATQRGQWRHGNAPLAVRPRKTVVQGPTTGLCADDRLRRLSLTGRFREKIKAILGGQDDQAIGGVLAREIALVKRESPLFRREAGG
jgi:hypothetical protein